MCWFSASAAALASTSGLATEAALASAAAFLRWPPHADSLLQQQLFASAACLMQLHRCLGCRYIHGFSSIVGFSSCLCPWYQRQLWVQREAVSLQSKLLCFFSYQASSCDRCAAAAIVLGNHLNAGANRIRGTAKRVKRCGRADQHIHIDLNACSPTMRPIATTNAMSGSR